MELLRIDRVERCRYEWAYLWMQILVHQGFGIIGYNRTFGGWIIVPDPVDELRVLKTDLLLVDSHPVANFDTTLRTWKCELLVLCMPNRCSGGNNLFTGGALKGAAIYHGTLRSTFGVRA